MEKLSKKSSNNKKGKTGKDTTDTEEISRLLEERNLLLKRINHNQNEKYRQCEVGKINRIQEKVLRKRTDTRNKKYKTTWEKIVNLKVNKQTEEYWRLIKRLRKEEDNRLPELIKTQRKTITGKKEIANEFARSYEQVYKGKDKEATHYRNNMERTMSSHAGC